MKALGDTTYVDTNCGDRKLTGDEQPVLAHPENWFGIGWMSALEFIYKQSNELA